MAETETALELAKTLLWGSYGPGAVEAHETHGTPLPPLTYRPLGELDTDHLEAILAHMEANYNRYSEAVKVCIMLVLEDRAIKKG